MSRRLIFVILLTLVLPACLVGQTRRLTEPCSILKGSQPAIYLSTSTDHLHNLIPQMLSASAGSSVPASSSSKGAVAKYGMVRARALTGNLLPALEEAPGCGAPPEPVTTFPVEYRALIPYDNVTGSAPGWCALIYGDITGIYAGDIPHGSNAVYPSSYRASLYDLVDVGAGGTSNVIADTGITTAFEDPSPVNGSYLTPTDWDGTLLDCYRETAWNQAQFGVAPNWYTGGLLTFSDASASLSLDGDVSNPLSFSALTIGWSVQTTLANDTSNRILNVTVSGEVTCFPQSVVLVDGQQVAQYTPPTSNSFYIGYCLATPATTPLTGPAVTPAGLNIYY